MMKEIKEKILKIVAVVAVVVCTAMFVVTSPVFAGSKYVGVYGGVSASPDTLSTLDVSNSSNYSYEWLGYSGSYSDSSNSHLSQSNKNGRLLGAKAGYELSNLPVRVELNLFQLRNKVELAGEEYSNEYQYQDYLNSSSGKYHSRIASGEFKMKMTVLSASALLTQKVGPAKMFVGGGPALVWGKTEDVGISKSWTSQSSGTEGGFSVAGEDPLFNGRVDDFAVGGLLQAGVEYPLMAGLSVFAEYRHLYAPLDMTAEQNKVDQYGKRSHAEVSLSNRNTDMALVGVAFSF